MNSDPEEDLPVGELPEEIGEAASDGDFERVKSWLDSSTRSFEEHLHGVGGPYAGDVRTLVASVRAAGSWKAHCRLAHKQVLRLRSLVVRGRAKLRTRRRLSRDACALEFLVRQGDNGIVWNILSFWREAA
jgi:hypothetical protein